MIEKDNYIGSNDNNDTHININNSNDDNNTRAEVIITMTNTIHNTVSFANCKDCPYSTFFDVVWYRSSLPIFIGDIT